MQIDSSVRPAGGGSRSASNISVRSTSAVSGMGDGGLDSDTNQAVRVIDRQPCSCGEFGAPPVVGVSEVTDIHPGTRFDQNTHDLRGSLVGRTMQGDAAGVGLVVRIDSEFKQQASRLQPSAPSTTRW